MASEDSTRPGPPTPAPQSIAFSPTKAAFIAAGVVGLVGAAVLVGWATGIPILKSVVPSWNAMQPLTAVALVLAAGALALDVLGWRLSQLILLLGPVLIASSALFQHWSGITLPGVDDLLFPEQVTAQPLRYPGRMVEVSAIEFLLFSAGIVWRRTDRPYAVLSTLGLTVGMVGLIGYLFGAQRLARMGSYTVLAIHTALAFVLLFLGLLLARPRSSWIIHLLSPRLGGRMARRLVPVVLLFPLVVGALAEGGGRYLGTQPAFRLAVAMVVVTSGLMLFALWMARVLNDADQRAEIALRALGRTEARLRAIVDTAVDAMVVIDDEGIMLSFNKAAERIFGYSAAEAIGQSVGVLMPEPHRSRHGVYLEAYKRTGRAKIIGVGREVMGRHKDGHTFPLELSIAEWRDAGQRFFTGIMRDISLRKRWSEDLAASEARFRTIFEQAAVGIELVAFDGRLLEVNQKVCELTGYTREELLSRTFEDITEPTDLVAEHRLLDDLLAGHSSGYVVEKRYRRKDGQPVWVRVTSSMQRQSGRDPQYRIAIIEDLREQKGISESLREVVARLEFVMEGASIGLWDWDLATGRMTWSEEVYRMTGLPPTMEPSYDNYFTVAVPGERESADRQIKELLARHDERFRVDVRIDHPVKGYRWIASLGRVSYGPDGNPSRMSGINMDITDLKLAEDEARRARDEAERANRAKSTFLAAASHDLRQPVQALVLFTAALTGRLKDHSAAHVVQDMQSSLDALQTLLEGLLDISRLDAGVITPNPQTFVLGDLIRRLGEEYRMRAREKELHLRYVPCSLRINADVTLLERVLRNLMENALRYTERGGILVGCRRRGATVHLLIRDTGVGIAEDQHEAIFQEFYQVGNPERDRAKGMGLGLSIVQRLVELLGYRLALSSVPGKGTTFTIEIPLAAVEAGVTPAAPPVLAAPGAQDEGGPAGLVLVIDDEAMIRLGLTVLLEDWGWEVVAAASGEEAMAWAEKSGRCADVIIADYRLRDGRVGTDAVRKLRAQWGRPVPALIITGDTAPERIAEVNRSGFEIAHKPVVPERLRSIVQTLRKRA